MLVKKPLLLSGFFMPFGVTTYAATFLQFCSKYLLMDIHDIEPKQDNEVLRTIIERLGIRSVETLNALEVNAIIEAIKQRPDNPIIYGDPLEEYISHRNE